jgi:hypothetical protein
MEPYSNLDDNERDATQQQYIALVVGFILIIPALLLSQIVFDNMGYGGFIFCLPIFFVGFSSIKNRVSIIRRKGQRGYCRGTDAIAQGKMFVILAIIIFLFGCYSIALAIYPLLISSPIIHK